MASGPSRTECLHSDRCNSKLYGAEGRYGCRCHRIRRGQLTRASGSEGCDSPEGCVRGSMMCMRSGCRPANEVAGSRCQVQSVLACTFFVLRPTSCRSHPSLVKHTHTFTRSSSSLLSPDSCVRPPFTLWNPCITWLQDIGRIWRDMLQFSVSPKRRVSQQDIQLSTHCSVSPACANGRDATLIRTE